MATRRKQSKQPEGEPPKRRSSPLMGFDHLNFKIIVSEGTAKATEPDGSAIDNLELRLLRAYTRGARRITVRDGLVSVKGVLSKKGNEIAIKQIFDYCVSTWEKAKITEYESVRALIRWNFPNPGVSRTKCRNSDFS